MVWFVDEYCLLTGRGEPVCGFHGVGEFGGDAADSP